LAQDPSSHDPSGQDNSRAVQTQALKFAKDLARLRREGRMLRKRIEDQRAVRTVLVADDDPFIRALIMATLAPETYEVIEAWTGAYALELVYEHHPRLVILDRDMPGPDGLSVCAQIKGDPDLRDVLVVMVTGNPGDEEAALAAGADRYLSKPFSPLDLIKTIDLLILGEP
jgi:CheY-like chemotaxis protein